MLMKRLALLALSFMLVFSLSGVTNIAYALDEVNPEVGEMAEVPAPAFEPADTVDEAVVQP